MESISTISLEAEVHFRWQAIRRPSVCLVLFSISFLQPVYPILLILTRFTPPACPPNHDSSVRVGDLQNTEAHVSQMSRLRPNLVVNTPERRIFSRAKQDLNLVGDYCRRVFPPFWSDPGITNYWTFFYFSAARCWIRRHVLLRNMNNLFTWDNMNGTDLAGRKTDIDE